MIRLERATSPSVLSPDNARRLTAEFIATGKTVWNIPELKEALLSSSHRKCAYCECDLSRESHYMEVEHFADKDRYPTLVVEWKNLLPSCKRCNLAKGTHDVVNEPIVNPYEEDPRLHLEFHLYRFRSSTKAGKNTIDVVDLNNHERVVQVRFEIGEGIHHALASAADALEKYQGIASTRNRNKLVGSVKAILLECQPASSYGGTAATVLLKDSIYASLRSEMTRLELWSVELQRLHVNAEQIAYVRSQPSQLLLADHAI